MSSSAISFAPPRFYLLRKVFQPRELVILGVLLVEILVFWIITPQLNDNGRQFITLGNLAEEARVGSLIGIAAVGAALVILTAGIDLSVGALFGLVGVVAAMLYTHPTLHLPVAVATVLALGVGVAVGLVNGVSVAYLKVPPFIVTLGTMSAGAGLALALTKGTPLPSVAAPFHADAERWLDALRTQVGAVGKFPGVSVSFLFMIALAIVVAFWLNSTPMGRHILALGGSEEASRHAGVRVPRVLLVTYALAGLLAGVAGLFYLAQYGSISSGVGPGKELDVIAAAVVGGVSLTGGKGSPIGAIGGAMIIQLLRSGLVFMGYPQAHAQIAIGLFIVLAAVLDRLIAHLMARFGQRRTLKGDT